MNKREKGRERKSERERVGGRAKQLGEGKENQKGLFIKLRDWWLGRPQTY